MNAPVCFRVFDNPSKFRCAAFLFQLATSDQREFVQSDCFRVR